MFGKPFLARMFLRGDFFCGVWRAARRAGVRIGKEMGGALEFARRVIFIARAVQCVVVARHQELYAVRLFCVGECAVCLEMVV